MVNPYAGREPTHIRVTPPTLKLLNSDCSGQIGQRVAIGKNRIFTKAPDDHKRYWQEMVGTYLRNELKLAPQLRRDLIFSLEFPRSYELYGNMRDNGAFDYYLIGFHKDNSIEKFDSPANFVLHAKWLAYGCPPGICCGCKPCSRRSSQKEISNQLTLGGAKISQPRDESTTTKASTARGFKEHKKRISRKPYERMRSLDTTE